MPIRFLALVGAVATLAFAAQADALTATQKVEKEITVTAADGSQSFQRVAADLVTPGEKIVYTVEFVNDSEEAATDLVLAMPVPSDVRYLEGSADREGAIVRYSTDGGATYSERTALTLPAVGGGTRTASAADITHIQWQIAGPVPVGATDAVAFKARLK